MNSWQEPPSSPSPGQYRKPERLPAYPPVRPGRAPARSQGPGRGGAAPGNTAPGNTAPAGPGIATGILFLFATLASAAALAATYYFFVRTTTGQFIDESALVEAVALGGTAGRAATKLLDLLPAVSVAAAAAVVLIVTVVGRRWTAAGIAVAACVGANMATQILKDLLPVRPFRGVETLELNSLPSGHTTMAASAAAAVFLMASPRWRPLAGFLGGSFAVASGVSTLVNQWHRPADVVAAFLVVAVFMLPAGWLVIRTGPRWNAWDGHGDHWAASRWWVAFPLTLVLVSAGLIGYVLLRSPPGTGLQVSTTGYFWAGTSLIVAAGYSATVACILLFGHAARRTARRSERLDGRRRGAPGR